MAYNAHIIANAFLAVADRHNEPISPLKLQKLVYFAHGWNLAVDGAPLLDEPIQAWPHGPAIYTLFRQFRNFGHDPITRPARNVAYRLDGTIAVVRPDPADDDEFFHAVVHRVWETHGNLTARQLAAASSRPGTPWRAIYDYFGGDIPDGITVPNDLIKDRFSRRLDEEKRAVCTL